MELDLSESHLLTSRPCPQLGTMVLLSSSSKSSKPSKQKVVLGDTTGRVSVYEMKRGEVNTVFTNESLLNSNVGGSGGPKDTSNDMSGGNDESFSSSLASKRKSLTARRSDPRTGELGL